MPGSHPRSTPGPGLSGPSAFSRGARRQAVRILGLIALGWGVSAAPPGVFAAAVPEPLVFRHENVLGTSLELRVRTDSAAQARAAETKVLAEMDRLARIFSTYDTGSEFSRWQLTRDQPTRVSEELLTVLQLAETWQTASAGAFHPAVGSLSRLWKDAAKAGVLPSETALARARELVAAPAWTLDPAARTATRLGQATLTLDAIAKGWIVERAGAHALKDQPGIQSLLLNVGGDLRHWGRIEERVDIADPRSDADNAPPLTSIRILNAALATSGGYRRHVRIGDRTYSHIIDPRSGQPASAVLAASVVAPDGASSDALATLLNLVGPTDVPALSNQLARADWMVVRADGTMLRSRGWARREAPPRTSLAAQPATLTNPAPPAPKPAAASVAPAGPTPAPVAARPGWPQGYELRVDFELNRPAGGRYARPYVAIWIEDSEGFPVRTLTLWLLQGEKGLRWLPDLRRWHRSDQVRALVDPRNLVNVVSSATRPPGRYGTVWDGRDDLQQPVPAGRYTLHIEASREHGTYQLMRHELEVGPKSFRAELPGNIEIKGATLAFGPKASTLSPTSR